jgi:hypothetical protein
MNYIWKNALLRLIYLSTTIPAACPTKSDRVSHPDFISETNIGLAYHLIGFEFTIHYPTPYAQHRLMMAENKALTLLQNRTKALRQLDKWYHKHIEPEATPAKQEEYAEITGPLRGILEKEAPSLAIADFRPDVLQAVFGVREVDPRNNAKLNLCVDERVSIPGSLGTFHQIIPSPVYLVSP